MSKKKQTTNDPSFRVIDANRRARHDFEIEETFEAGLVLCGSEVKSLRDGHGSLSDSYGSIEEGEAWLVNSHIAEYPWAHRANHPPRRKRKLLLHAREIEKLAIKVRERGYTLVPLRLYFRASYVKVELGLGRGRKTYDKREAIKKRETQMDVRKMLGRRE